MSIRRNMGPPLEWTDEDLDEMARVQPQDVDAMRVAWRARVRAPFDALVDAIPDDIDEDAGALIGGG